MLTAFRSEQGQPPRRSWDIRGPLTFPQCWKPPPLGPTESWDFLRTTQVVS